MGFALRWLFLLSAAYAAIVVVMLFLENALVFRPSHDQQSPVNPRTIRIEIESAGERIDCWWLPPERAGAGAVLLCHGNGGNISHRGRMADDLHRELGLGVFLLDYPGYGQSTGKPSEAGCYASSEAAFQWLRAEAKIPARRIVLMGESLGGGPAVELAITHECRALVLLYTFTSVPAAAKSRFPWLPTHTLMRNRFDNLAKITRVTCPVFIAHGTEDATIPFRQGQALFAAANEPKMFLPLEGYPHSLIANDPFYSELARFLAAHPPAAN